MPSPDNARAVLRALERFGAPMHDLTEADLQKDDTIFQIGIAPRRIDIITGATGLRFNEASARAMEIEIEGIRVRVLSLDDLIRNKRACGRAKDLADVEALKSLRDSQPPKPPGSASRLRTLLLSPLTICMTRPASFQTCVRPGMSPSKSCSSSIS